MPLSLFGEYSVGAHYFPSTFCAQEGDVVGICFAFLFTTPRGIRQKLPLPHVYTWLVFEYNQKYFSQPSVKLVFN